MDKSDPCLFKECVLNMKIDCFSVRENSVLAEVLETARNDVKNMFAKDEVKMLTANQKKVARCGLGSGLESGSSTVTASLLMLVSLSLFAVL